MGFGDRAEPQMMAAGAREAEGGAAGDKGGKRGGKAKEEGVDVRAEAKLWKRRNAEARVTHTFRTAEEVLAEAAERPAEAAARPTIIDMRGPQARVVANMDHLNVEEEGGGGGAVPMPELQHNLRLLVDLAEADISRLDGKLRHEKDTAVRGGGLRGVFWVLLGFGQEKGLLGWARRRGC